MWTQQISDLPTSAGGPSAAASSLLVSTGIPALDGRLSGLVRGRHYLLDGAPGAGKSSAALHFLGSGIVAGECCMILTQDDPADLIAQGEFLGYDLRAAAEEDRLIILQYRLDFPQNYSRAADPTRVLHELRSHFEEHKPQRFVIDSMSPFIDGGRAAEEALTGFPEFLDSIECTTYLTVPGDLADSYYSRLYDRVIASSAGIFHFELGEGQVRKLSIRKLRQPVNSTAALHVVLRPGVGIVEHEPSRLSPELPEPLRRRLVVLNQSLALPEEVMLTLQRRYEVVCYESVEQALANLVAAQYGVLLINVLPRDTERAFQLTRELRRTGNGAPILFVSAHRGLRGSTRARGLRAGADDFLTDALSPEEFVERIEVARERGHRRLTAEDELQPVFLQPMLSDGSYALLSEDEFRGVVTEKLRNNTHPFFALVLVQPQIPRSEAWSALTASLRVSEGDLGAALRDGRIGLYLHDVRRSHLDPLLQRVSNAHPGLGPAHAMEVFTFPGDRRDVEIWLGLSESVASAPA
jgi:KaiC/GvpD/RAD55 family RecA-like ATPase